MYILQAIAILAFNSICAFLISVIRNIMDFYLTELISLQNIKTATDTGCGTGKQTHIDKANFIGIDSLAEMLAKSKQSKTEKLDFKLVAVQEFIHYIQKFDLIFSNAALQWSDNHEELFPNLISHLSENRQFSVQMPCRLIMFSI